MDAKERKLFFDELDLEEKACYVLNRVLEIKPVKEMTVQKVKDGKVVEEIQVQKKVGEVRS